MGVDVGIGVGIVVGKLVGVGAAAIGFLNGFILESFVPSCNRFLFAVARIPLIAFVASKYVFPTVPIPDSGVAEPGSGLVVLSGNGDTV